MSKLWLMGAATAAFMAGPVSAQEPRAVVVGPQHNLTGDVGTVVERIAANVAAGLEAVGYLVVVPEDAARCAGADVSESGLRAAAAACAVQVAAGGTVEQSGGGYSLRLTLVATDGLVLADLERPCDFCTEGEMVERWREVAAEVGAPPEAVRAAAAGTARPPDEERPWEGPEAGQEAVAAAGTPAEEGALDVPWWFWAGLGASIATAGAGVAPLVLDGKGTCDGPLESCPEIYDTAGVGWTLVGLGIAGLAATGLALYLVSGDEAEEGGQQAEEEDAAAGVALLPGPGALILLGWFGP
jgi:hypothetical protein